MTADPTPAPDPRAAEVYQGYRDEHGTTRIRVLVPTTNALGDATGWEDRGEVPHRVRHSPTGMNWGYSGSGPADTARSLLLYALPDARCPECAGNSLLVISGREPRPYDHDTDHELTADAVTACWECEGDGLASVPYQRFKFTNVTHWTGPEFSVTRSEILTWLADNTGPHTTTDPPDTPAVPGG